MVFVVCGGCKEKKNYYVKGLCSKCYYAKNKKHISNRRKENLIKNGDKIRERARKYYSDNVDRIKPLAKKYREKTKDRMKEYKKKYYIENREKILKERKEYIKKPETKKRKRKISSTKEHKHKMAKWNKKYREDNKEKLTLLKKIYFQNNKRKIITKQRTKRRESIHLRLRHNLSKRVYDVLKYNSHSKTTIKLLSCTIQELKQHLQNQFTFGMNWKNYGYGWHIDHIKPCCSFDLTQPEEQLKCFHYTNLQPLWARENLKKGGRTTR